MLLLFVAVSVQVQLYGFKDALLRSSLNLSIVALLFYLHFYLIDLLFEKRKYILYSIAIIGVTVLATLGRIFFNEEFVRLPVEEIVIDRTVSVWLFGIFTAIVALVLSFLYQMVKNRYEKEKEHLEIINEQNETQLQYLKAQINPHFLFNTLNNIYSLSVVKSDLAPEMIVKLSSILRYAIYDGEKGKVNLSKEVKQIQEFISLFQMKSEHDLNVQFNIEGEIDKWEIEPMLLIPLVENCFKHGDYETNENTFIKLDLRIDNDELIFYSENSKRDNKQKDDVGGVGIANIKKRLEVNYPNLHNLELNELENTFKVELRINNE